MSRQESRRLVVTGRTRNNIVKGPLSNRSQCGFQDQLLLNAGQKYCRMLPCRSKVLQNAPREHSAILLTFIKLPFVIKIFVLSVFEWLFYTGFTAIVVQAYSLKIDYLSVKFISILFFFFT